MDTPETEFLKDAHKSFIVSIGMKRHGKTYMMLQYLKYALENDLFDYYHLVLPQFGHERDGAYQFLNQYKNKVKVYDRYHKVISDKLLKDLGKQHNFFVIDDATGELGRNFDDSLTKLVTCNEHGLSCAIWMCIHAGKKVLPPLARGMLNYLFLYYTTNQVMLKGFWEEYFSKIYRTFDEFLNVYDAAVEREIEKAGKVNAIMFSVSGAHEMNGIVDWELNKKKFDLKPNKNVKMKVQNIDAEKEKLLEKKAFLSKKLQIMDNAKKPKNSFSIGESVMKTKNKPRKTTFMPNFFSR